MLDIKFIRENPDEIRKNLKKRRNNEKLKELDRVIELDEKVRKLKWESQKLRTQRNKLSRKVGELKKAGKDASEIIEKVNGINAGIEEIEKKQEILEENLIQIQMRIPNMLHESVPYGKDEEDDEVVSEWGGKPDPGFGIKSHVDLIETLDLADIPRAAKIAGSRFFFLKNELVMLDIAMQKLALEMLIDRGFSPIYPPFMMRRTPYEGVTDLADFGDVMYKMEEEDLYLIATSEHPIAAMYMDEIFEPTNLPIKFAGISTCFRKEAGTHGKDTKGIFRVHQFSKVEQFVFSHPDDSWKIHEELRENMEAYFRKLEIPYRIVNVCTGDIGIVASKKYDLEAWMPGQDRYRELGSCSNCTAYQATRLNIKHRIEKGSVEKDYLHTLNSTMVANPRAFVAILENFQQEGGTVKIPKALHKYLPPNMTEIRVDKDWLGSET